MLHCLRSVFLLVAAAGAALSLSNTKPSTLSSGTLPIGNGNYMFYTDTGAPPGKSPYTTLFLIHGMSFNSGIFQKTKSDILRIVSVNRRGYIGSSPYTNTEFNVITNGTSAARQAFLADRGVELAVFIDNFLQQKKITQGKVSISGWSVGNIFSLATLSSVNSWPVAIKARLAPRIQSVIMQEPSAEILGFASNPNNWIPLIDTSIPASTRNPMTVQWISHYFKQGNFAVNPNAITWVVPSLSRVPSLFNMSPSEYNSIVDIGKATDGDFTLLINFKSQLHDSYRQVIFGSTVQKAFPTLKRSLFTGDSSVSFGPYAYYLVKNDTGAINDKSVTFRIVPGVNHFINWDDPKIASEVYAQLV
ncbi:hypothetical protein H0H81_008775 [Sphagnurus paluster]|uniref:AB hydrolase-1 domain-containing protein n=1 Tax=Sphagnurus paluster TaxID=117069 RepID=A0A9P7GMT8_9AGAR|nr:hypothetical protein H0H81_008775 [Sphagnurus paluster]